jgi:hypothetical protein
MTNRPLRPCRRTLALALAVALTPTAVAAASTSHAGWPVIQHHQINKTDANITLNAVPGVHNELLGGNGDDTINGSNAGDVLWGDYKPGNQSTTQVDHINAGSGMDFIYASHGTNIIYTGGGGDKVHAHFGRGQIHCGSKTDLVYLSHQSRPHYKLYGCKRISYKTLGY